MRMILCMTLIVCLIGCTTQTEVKAPCDYYGNYCGTKFKINQEN